MQRILRVMVVSFIVLIQLCLSPAVWAGDSLNTTFIIGSDTYQVNGVEKRTDAPARVIGGRVYLPLRSACDGIGVSSEDIKWDPQEMSVSITRGQTTVKLTVGKLQMLVNGEEKTLDAARIVFNGRVTLPIGPLARALGYEVSWDAGRQMVTISSQEGSDSSDQQNSFSQMVWQYQGNCLPCQIRFQPGGNLEVVKGELQDVKWGMEGDVLVLKQSDGKVICRFTSVFSYQSKLLLMGPYEPDNNIICILKEIG